MNVIAPLIIALFGATGTQSTPATVLFVCEHGAVKSVVAAAHFNRLAEARGLPFRAISRGTAPDAAVPPRIVDGLESEGLAVPAGFVPAPVAPSDVSSASRVVTFDVTLPHHAVSTPVERWDGLPAFSDGYGPASAAILARISELLRQLASAKKH